HSAVGRIEQLVDSLGDGELLRVRQSAFLNGSDFFCDEDARIGDGREHGRVTKVENDARMRGVEQVRAQPFAVGGAHVFVAGDEAEHTAGAQKLEGALEKIHVKVGCARVALVKVLECVL